MFGASQEIATMHATIKVKKDDLDKGLKDTKGGLEKFKTGLMDNIKTAGLLAGAVAGVGIAVKQTFDFAKEGASARQLGESFDLLMDKVGAGPDIFNDLKSASNGVIDDLTLMSSTQMLLAGTSGEVSTAFAKAMPKLVEYARAANKLNPALGDTTFLLESLSTGIKRGQKNIIDNLGIVFSAENAYNDYAASIGKTADQLTDAQKQLAFLNATLDKGEILLDQAGGTADSLTDSYTQLEIEIKNTTDDLKMQLSEALLPVAKAAGNLISVSTNLRRAWQAGNIEYLDGVRITAMYQLGLWDLADVLAEIDRLQNRTAPGTRAVAQAQASSAAEARGFAIGMALVNAQLEQNVVAVDKSMAMMYKYQMAQYEAAQSTGALEDRIETASEKMDTLNTLVGGTLTKSTEDFTKRQTELAGAMDAVKGEIDLLSGKKHLTDAQREELLELEEKYKGMQETYTNNANEHDEATKRIVYNLAVQRAAVDGLSDAEYEALNQMAEDWGLIDEKTAFYVKNADKYFKDLAAGLVGPIGLVEYLNQQLDATERVRQAHVNIVTNYTSTGLQSSGLSYSNNPGAVPQGPGGAHGLDMIVPPGYPNDTYPVRATSGERVKIIPAGEDQAGGTAGDAPIQINVYGSVTSENAYTLASEVGSEINRLRRYS